MVLSFLALCAARTQICLIFKLSENSVVLLSAELGRKRLQCCLEGRSERYNYSFERVLLIDSVSMYGSPHYLQDSGIRWTSDGQLSEWDRTQSAADARED